MNSIRAVGYNAYRRLTTAIPYLRQTGPMSQIGLITPEILPIVPLVMGVLYQWGQREHMGINNGAKNEVLLGIEGLLTQQILRRANDVAPYIPLAVGAYEMGQADGTREKIYSILKTATLFTAGYFGATNLGTGITNAQRVLESDRILHAIDTPEMRAAMSAGKKNRAPNALQNAIETLCSKAQQQKQIIERLAENKKMTASVIENTERQLIKAKKAFLTQAEQAGESLASLGGEDLLKVVKSYQAGYVRLLRRVNPTIGYFLGVTLIGIPLTSIIGGIMGAGYSKDPEDDVNLVKPIWLKPMLDATKNFWPFSTARNYY